MYKKSILKIIFFAFLLIYSGGSFAMKISSTAFNNHGIIPAKHTCQGDNVSPNLHWKDLPHGTKSLALIMDDPDAPMSTWVHWVLYNIPHTTTELSENIKVLPAGTVSGLTSWDKSGYGGPCPPSGIHRYFFKLYALDTFLDLKGKVTGATLQKAMHGHILGSAELMGQYKKS